jgi:hypothetical protein
MLGASFKEYIINRYGLYNGASSAFKIKKIQKTHKNKEIFNALSKKFNILCDYDEH